MGVGMHALYLGPGWFYGPENMVNLFTILVCVLIFFFGMKIYKLALNNNYKVFSFAFLLFAISFLIQAVTHFAMYIAFKGMTPFEAAPLVDNAVSALGIVGIYRAGYFWMMLTFLLGLLFLLVVALKIRKRRLLVILAYFILLTSFAAFAWDLIFYLTSALLLFVVTLFYYENYLKKRTVNSFLVVVSFGLLMLSQLVLVLHGFGENIYVTGRLIQLLGFVGLLVNYVLVLKK